MTAEPRTDARREHGIRHILFDVDGVLYDSGGRELPVAVELVGADRVEEFLTRLAVLGLPSLTGDGTFRDALAEVLPDYAITASAAEVEDRLLGTSRPVEASLALIPQLRAAGLGVHLGTNQDTTRAAFLRGPAGFDDLFDVGCYSCEMGVAKPEAAFYAEALAMIGAEPAQVLFIDDRAENVEAAREVGLAAEVWHVRQGHQLLLEFFARHGILLPAA